MGHHIGPALHEAALRQNGAVRKLRHKFDAVFIGEEGLVLVHEVGIALIGAGAQEGTLGIGFHRRFLGGIIVFSGRVFHGLLILIRSSLSGCLTFCCGSRAAFSGAAGRGCAAARHECRQHYPHQTKLRYFFHCVSFLSLK